MTDTKEKPSCAHCGEQLDGRGIRADKMFCTNRRACQNARMRWVRSRDLSEEDWETRPCSSCRRPLPKRTKRVTDVPEGRWCSRHRCQRAREQVMETAGKDTPRRVGYQRPIFSLEQLQAAPVAECLTCARLDAREGFAHPMKGLGATGKPCYAGHGPDAWWRMISRETAEAEWPGEVGEWRV